MAVIIHYYWIAGPSSTVQYVATAILQYEKTQREFLRLAVVGVRRV